MATSSGSGSWGLFLELTRTELLPYFTLFDFLPGALLWSQLPCPAVGSWLVCEGGTQSSVLYSCSQLQVLSFMHQVPKHALAFLPMQLSDALDLPPLPESPRQMISSLSFHSLPPPKTPFFQEPFILTPTFPSKTPSPKFSQHQYFRCWDTTSASYLMVLPLIFINVSDFVWPRCYQNSQAACSSCSSK